MSEQEFKADDDGHLDLFAAPRPAAAAPARPQQPPSTAPAGTQTTRLDTHPEPARRHDLADTRPPRRRNRRRTYP